MQMQCLSLMSFNYPKFHNLVTTSITSTVHCFAHNGFTQPIHRWKTTGNKFKCNKFTKAVNIETKILFSHGKLHKIDAESALHNKLINGHQMYVLQFFDFTGPITFQF